MACCAGGSSRSITARPDEPEDAGLAPAKVTIADPTTTAAKKLRRLALEGTATFKGPPQREFVGIFEVTADGKPTGDARHRDPGVLE